jgi:hypothetical protein
MHAYPGPPCKHCGGTIWKRISMPVFRVEECIKCHTNRTTTDPGVGAEHPPGSVVYIVVEAWGSLPYGDVIGVFSSQAGAEQEAARRTDPARPMIKYLVKRYEVLAEPPRRS